MSFDASNIKAVIFDYGNTLVEFGSKQVEVLNGSLLSKLREWYGECDEKEFSDIRKSQIIAPYGTEEFIENDREEICVELVEALYDITPGSERVYEMMDIKHRTFVETLTIPDFVVPILEELKSNYKLAFISNYPCRESIVDSLKKTGISDFFESVVVSGEMGVVKPHPRIFQKCLLDLALSPDECVYVGDNWLADIQGAKLMGMRAIHTTQYVSYEKFEPFEGDLQPDAVITHLNQLTQVLRPSGKVQVDPVRTPFN
jgi:FMN phosphatase YigB (HAD superfamily)